MNPKIGVPFSFERSSELLIYFLLIEVFWTDHATRIARHFSGAALGQEKMYQENLGLPGYRLAVTRGITLLKTMWPFQPAAFPYLEVMFQGMLQTCLGADFSWIPEGQMIISPKKIHNSNLFFGGGREPQKNATSNHLSSWLVNLPPPNVPPPRKRGFIRPY